MMEHEFEIKHVVVTRLRLQGEDTSDVQQELERCKQSIRDRLDDVFVQGVGRLQVCPATVDYKGANAIPRGGGA